MTNKDMAEFIAVVVRKWGHFGKGMNAGIILEKCRNQEELDQWFYRCVKFRSICK